MPIPGSWSARRLLLKLSGAMKEALDDRVLFKIQSRYRHYSMMPPETFVANLWLCREYAPPSGCVVECGVWRGGMSAGIADVLPGRLHYLFDSFEGLPAPTAPDANAAGWGPHFPNYFDNCRAEQGYAEKAMALSKARSARVITGWFDATVPGFKPDEPIAVLRLDGDWYESTMTCLVGLYDCVLPSGVVIIDDYWAWDGCARAVHDFLSRTQSTARIRVCRDVAFLLKDDPAAKRRFEIGRRPAPD
jgi:O-methyltransferase